VTDFAKDLLAWFDVCGRKDLPWQSNTTPYRVWVSEIMLQQTQVQTVIPYYERFMQSFPNVAALANADIDAVLEHWSGLGYYARARNLHKAAQMIRDDYQGELPTTLEAMQLLPGVGRSTAAAILSLTAGQRHAILDGNVKRVLARHRGIDGWPGKTAVAKALWSVAETLTPTERCADYTQAIMDVGATVCTRSRPRCDSCPLGQNCIALAEGRIAELPGRKPKKAKPLRQTTMLLAVVEDSIYMERRPASGIWGGLWSFPEVELPEINRWCDRISQKLPAEREEWTPLRHSFSHFDLDIHPLVLRFASAQPLAADNSDSAWYPLQEQPPGGIAAPVQKLIDLLRNSENVANH
jgi:A/G-specific adenine glycosylase